MRALVWKELRELVGITAAALIAYLALVVALMGGLSFNSIPPMPGGPEDVPFTSGGFMGPFILISVVFAVVLGFRQSAWESSRGTFLFLLHRPVSRDTIIGAKLMTGLGVLLLCSSVPILLYGGWVAVPGHHAGPFEWSMSEPAWTTSLQMTLLYLGAFLSGLRPARWFGTRLLPLIASVGLLILVVSVPWWWYLGFPLTLALGGLLAANSCFVARVRDYA